jgi:D-ribulokinase
VPTEPLFLGIDLGTQGARVVVANAGGQVIGESEKPLRQSGLPGLPSGWAEQEPSDWWQATREALQELIAMMGPRAAHIIALAVTSTSGTICAVDEKGSPLTNGLMYNDNRALFEAEEVNQAGKDISAKLGYNRFLPSGAICKIYWLKRNQPQIYERAKLIIHAADYIVGKLSGEFGVSDYSNALKTGYDLIEEEWPAFIPNKLGIPLEKLPKVTAPGTKIGEVSKEAAAETGVPAGIAVISGMTDGCASQVSTGAMKPGDWNTTIGTTLVLKGVTRNILIDPLGRVYCHKHPQGYWLPGGASNTGGEGLSKEFSHEEWQEFNAKALQLAPTDIIVYPLARKGERFPFFRPEAAGFVLGKPAERAQLYVAYLEGVGYLERLAYETLESLGATVGDVILTAGGATRSEPWLQIRADILGKAMLRPAQVGAAFGMAVLAAAGCHFKHIIEACDNMVKIVERVEPNMKMHGRYEERYGRFLSACKENGYI